MSDIPCTRRIFARIEVWASNVATRQFGEVTMPVTSIWIMKGDVPTGPFTVEQIHAQLAAGEITWHTRACPVGTSAWTTLVTLPQFGHTSVSQPEQSDERIGPNNSASTPSTSAGGFGLAVGDGKRSAPWNPIAIAWLGIPFTPMWAGVMAAINGRRLGMSVSVGTPLAIGFGYLAADIAIEWVIDSGWVSLGLYASSLALLWFVVLRPQSVAFVQSTDLRHGSAGRWLWPSVSGAPLAVLMIFATVVLPLMPLEPREVCEKFIAARTATEAAKYTTGKLMPALEAINRIPDDRRLSHFELTDEAIAPADVGGYLVGWRHTSEEGRQPIHVEGVFHLTQWSGTWKIEELYYTTVNGQTFEKWPALSVDYPTLLQAPTPASTSPVRSPAPPNTSKYSSSSATNKSRPWHEMLLKNPVLLRSLGMAGLVLGSAIFKSRRSPANPSPQENSHG